MLHHACRQAAFHSGLCMGMGMGMGMGECAAANATRYSRVQAHIYTHICIYKHTLGLYIDRRLSSTAC